MTSWANLPNEMKLSVVDLLDNYHDVKALAITEKNLYLLSVPALFKTVRLDNWQAMKRFLQVVPPSYLAYIQELQLCTRDADLAVALGSSTPEDDDGDQPYPRTHAVKTFLSASSLRLKSLVLNLWGPLENSIIPVFGEMRALQSLCVRNLADEASLPISERWVVSVAASVPTLEHLALDTITRSYHHTHNPTFHTLHDLQREHISLTLPLVLNDTNIPSHPVLAGDLSLPNLLRLGLKSLRMKNVHLGDVDWMGVPLPRLCMGKLKVLDVGCGCIFDDGQGGEKEWVERILGRVGDGIDELGIGIGMSHEEEERDVQVSSPTALTPSTSDQDTFSPPPFSPSPQRTANQLAPLKSLRRLYISPNLPPTELEGTLKRLKGSPVEKVCVGVWEDDVEEVCEVVEGLLGARVGEARCDAPHHEGDDEEGVFLDKLKKIELCVCAPEYPDDESRDLGSDSFSSSAAFATVAPSAGASTTSSTTSTTIDGDDDDTDDDDEDDDEAKERREAIERLADFCEDLGLEVSVRWDSSVSGSKDATANKYAAMRVVDSVTRCPDATKPGCDDALALKRMQMQRFGYGYAHANATL
ncbi:hypothetical protein ONZ45_g6101 [Pleurotus djamor]|nr:hypothetical protein ONZ45_g6101 [Pleurotus djamor]